MQTEQKDEKKLTEISVQTDNGAVSEIVEDEEETYLFSETSIIEDKYLQDNGL